MRKKQYTSEEALSALVAAKEEGLDYFFTLYYSRLTYFAFKLLGDQFLSEEIASEAFVKLWHRRCHFSNGVSVKAWLYTTVRNECLNQLRNMKRQRIKIDPIIFAQEITEHSILHSIIQSETLHQIIHSLQVLPPKCGEVFKLFYLQGKSYEEIAHLLQISTHTVRNQKARAIRILRAKVSCAILLISLFAFF